MRDTAIIKTRPGTEVLPETVAPVTPEDVTGRRVLQWASHGGSYGMGGPGFFGFLLAEGNGRPEEWLLLCLWSAADWVLVDGRWLEAHSCQYNTQMPLVHNGIDGLTPLVVGHTIDVFDVGDKFWSMSINGHVVEVAADPETRPHWAGNDQPRVLGPEEKMIDAWIFTNNLGISI